MSTLSRLVEALPPEIRTHKAVLQLKEQRGVKFARRLWRIVTRHNPRVVRRYLSGNAVRKLNLGCGYHRLPGWLNCDFDPMREAILLDAASRFPFLDDTFDFIYSEHMIEHLPYAGGRTMLAECHRVLRPGGVLRIATPDVRFLFRLYRGDRGALEADYIAWSGVHYLGDDAPHTALGVLNNYMRDWGHTFLYDPDALRRSLEAAGFVAIAAKEVGESDEPALRDLEYSARMPAGFYNLETFILQATKSTPTEKRD
jgi:predicted SAM-dependent methyltransferase